LCNRMDDTRKRDCVLEYHDFLKHSEIEALAFLTKMVSIVTEPWKILTEVARLRDSYRSRLAEWQKEIAVTKRREREARLHCEEQKRKVFDLQRAHRPRPLKLRSSETCSQEEPSTVKRTRTL